MSISRVLDISRVILSERKLIRARCGDTHLKFLAVGREARRA